VITEKKVHKTNETGIQKKMRMAEPTDSMKGIAPAGSRRVPNLFSEKVKGW
jgi:hypothetical protein